MIALITDRLDEIAALCRRLHVRRLQVFGSAARGDDWREADSDIDFRVEFEPLTAMAYFDAYFDLKEALEALFGRPVDLLTDVPIANPYRRASIERDLRTVFEA